MAGAAENGKIIEKLFIMYILKLITIDKKSFATLLNKFSDKKYTSLDITL